MENSLRKMCLRHANAAAYGTLHDHLDDGDLHAFQQLSIQEQDQLSMARELYSNASDPLRRLLLKSILFDSCSSQISLIESEIKYYSKVDFLSELPNELAVYILKKLDIQSISAASTVSKRWNSVCNDDNLWFHLCGQHIGKRCDGCGINLPVVRYKPPQISAAVCSSSSSSSSPTTVNASHRSTSEDHHHHHLNNNYQQQIQTQRRRYYSKWKQIFIDRYIIDKNWEYNRHVAFRVDGQYSLVKFCGESNTLLAFNNLQDELVCFKIADAQSMSKPGYAVELYRVPMPQSINDLYFDARKIVAFGGHSIFIMALNDGSLLSEIKVSQLFQRPDYFIEFSATDGQKIVVLHRSILVVYDPGRKFRKEYDLIDYFGADGGGGMQIIIENNVVVVTCLSEDEMNFCFIDTDSGRVFSQTIRCALQCLSLVKMNQNSYLMQLLNYYSEQELYDYQIIRFDFQQLSVSAGGVMYRVLGEPIGYGDIQRASGNRFVGKFSLGGIFLAQQCSLHGSDLYRRPHYQTHEQKPDRLKILWDQGDLRYQHHVVEHISESKLVLRGKTDIVIQDYSVTNLDI
ncbi:hypothetical protein MIR68_003724 [Amoeboaphelidium protococcarum]|nr:hypothetical protein MIR68_003724 [Amoeboaphelidium protococcarum]